MIIRAIVLLSVIITGTSFVNQALSQSTPDTPIEIAFLTDVHLNNTQKAINGFSTAIKEVNVLNPHFVIFGGDQIMDALKVPYDTAMIYAKLFDSISSALTIPALKTIGNHDIFGIYFGDSLKQHPSYSKAFYEQNFGKKNYTFDFMNWRFFFINGITITKNHKYIGAVDSLQIEWIKSVLDTTNAEKQLALITHIPFYSIGYQIWKGSLEAAPAHGLVKNSNEIVRLFANHNLRLILQGHLHIYEKIYVQDMWVITGGAVSSRWWQGKNNGLEEGFTKLTLYPDGQVEANYHAIDWEIPY